LHGSCPDIPFQRSELEWHPLPSKVKATALPTELNSGHSTHFQGGDTPKVEGQEFF